MWSRAGHSAALHFGTTRRTSACGLEMRAAGLVVKPGESLTAGGSWTNVFAPDDGTLDGGRVAAATSIREKLDYKAPDGKGLGRMGKVIETRQVRGEEIWA